MLLYRFTSGVHAATGATPWDTARAGVTIEAQPTTRSLMYQALAAALVAAGWERFDRKTAGVSPTQATFDDVWVSRGESGDHQIHIRTALHNASGGAGTQYISVLVAPKRNDVGVTLSGTWTWDGTLTVLTTNTSQVVVGSYIGTTAGIWFKIASIVPNTSVTITNPLGYTVPSGVFTTFTLAPDLQSDIGNSALGNTTPFNVDTFRWDLGASDFTADFQIVCSKDFFSMVLQNTAHTGSMFTMHFGDLIPLDVNANNMYLSSTVVAGDFVDLITLDKDGNPVNPIVLGFRPMDRIQIVQVDPQSTSRAETQQIVRVQSDRITVRRLRFGYQGYVAGGGASAHRDGARIGMYSSPVFMQLGINTEVEVAASPSSKTNRLRTPFFHDAVLDGAPPSFPARTEGDLCSAPTVKAGEAFYFLHYGQLTTHAQGNTEYGSGTTPNARTLRFTIRTVSVGYYSATDQGGALIGKIPRLATYNGTTVYYPHDNYLRDRVTPNEDYVPFRYTSASARNYVLGPTPGP